MVEDIIAAFIEIFTWPTILWAVLGVFIGIIGGALPGLGATVTMVIFLPFTASLSQIPALIFLIGIYNGAHYGGSIAAVLINVPGTPAAAATTLDGYPLTKQGYAKEALTISALSSGMAGLIMSLALFVLTPVLLIIVLLFGSPQYFLMTVIGLALIVIVTKGSMVRGFIAGGLGALYASVGIAATLPDARYTFDTLILLDGLSFIAALIGLFAIAELLVLVKRESIAIDNLEVSGNVMNGVRAVIRNPITLIKSTFLGLFIGSLPGAGASAANFIAYAEEIRAGGSDKNYGEGEFSGIIACESSNNASVGGALIPTLSFGIPGSAATAVLLGGMLLHGLIPGPNMFTENIQATNAMFAMLAVGALIIITMGTTLLPQIGHYFTRIDTNIIIPIVVVLATLGGYGLRYNIADLLIGVLFLGLVGYYFKKYNYSVIAFVLGAILAPIAEENLVRSLELSDGSWMIFVNDPLSAILTIILLIVLIGPHVDMGEIRNALQ